MGGGGSKPAPAPRVVTKTVTKTVVRHVPKVVTKTVVVQAQGPNFKVLMAQKFSEVKVDMRQLKLAKAALEEAKTTSYNFSLANDKFRGVKKEDLEAFGEILCAKLNLTLDTNKSTIKNSLKLAGLSDDGENAMQEFNFDEDEFTSIYGFLIAKKQIVKGKRIDKIDIASTVSRLTFSVAGKRAFTPDQLAAIKNHYSKNEALENLVQENVITKITYC